MIAEAGALGLVVIAATAFVTACAVLEAVFWRLWSRRAVRRWFCRVTGRQAIRRRYRTP